SVYKEAAEKPSDVLLLTPTHTLWCGPVGQNVSTQTATFDHEESRPVSILAVEECHGSALIQQTNNLLYKCVTWTAMGDGMVKLSPTSANGQVQSILVLGRCPTQTASPTP